VRHLRVLYRRRLISPLAWVWVLLVSPGALLSLQVEIQSELVLSGDVARAQDVRWADGDTVYLAVARLGALKLSLQGKAPPRVLSRTGPGPGEIVLTTSLARSDSHLAVASAIYEVAWRRHGQPEGLEDKAFFEFIEDVALFENHLVVLAIRRHGDHRLAPGGGIGWITTLGHGPAKFRPILFSQTGPGAQAMDRCSVSELGVLRFLADGSLVVVPGAEPDVLLLGPAGEQIFSWETEPLGIGMRCDHSDEKRDLLSRFVHPESSRLTHQVVLLTRPRRLPNALVFLEPIAQKN